VHLISQREADNSARIVLKGHLALEEKLDAIIESFFFPST
jgi:hypothetical protein